MNDDPKLDRLGDFLDAVATRAPTPGGGAVAAAAGALACAIARMVTAYSPGKSASDDDAVVVADAAPPLERCDRLLRTLIIEDAHAYTALTDAARKLKQDPATAPAHATAVGVAAAVPLEVAALATEAMDVLERLLPAANPYLLSDLGVAAVLADATVRAASYMVRVNATTLTDAEARREVEASMDRLVARAGAALERIESALVDRM